MMSSWNAIALLLAIAAALASADSCKCMDLILLFDASNAASQNMLTTEREWAMQALTAKGFLSDSSNRIGLIFSTGVVSQHVPLAYDKSAAVSALRTWEPTKSEHSPNFTAALDIAEMMITESTARDRSSILLLISQGANVPHYETGQASADRIRSLKSSIFAVVDESSTNSLLGLKQLACGADASTCNNVIMSDDATLKSAAFIAKLEAKLQRSTTSTCSTSSKQGAASLDESPLSAATPPHSVCFNGICPQMQRCCVLDTGDHGCCATLNMTCCNRACCQSTYVCDYSSSTCYLPTTTTASAAPTDFAPVHLPAVVRTDDKYR